MANGSSCLLMPLPAVTRDGRVACCGSSLHSAYTPHMWLVLPPRHSTSVHAIACVRFYGVTSLQMSSGAYYGHKRRWIGTAREEFDSLLDMDKFCVTV